MLLLQLGTSSPALSTPCILPGGKSKCRLFPEVLLNSPKRNESLSLYSAGAMFLISHSAEYFLFFRLAKQAYRDNSGKNRKALREKKSRRGNPPIIPSPRNNCLRFCHIFFQLYSHTQFPYCIHTSVPCLNHSSPVKVP